MASAEVISKPVVATKNKNKDLEAGRRKLEEFRRKKAGTKNSKQKSQPSTDDTTKCEKQVYDNGHVSPIDSVSDQTGGSSNTVPGSSGLSDHNDKSHGSTHYYGSDSVLHAQSENLSEPGSLQKLTKQGGNSYETSGLDYPSESKFTLPTDYSVGDGNSSTDIGENIYANFISSRPSLFQDSSSNDSRPISYKFDNSSLSFEDTNKNTNDVAAKAYTEGLVTNPSHLEPDSAHSSINFRASASEHGHRYQEIKDLSSFGLEERNTSNAVGNYVRFESQQASEQYLSSNSTVDGLFNGPSYSAVNESYNRRSRPSFLDSLNIKDSSVFNQPSVDNEKITKTNFSSSTYAVSSAIHSPFTGLSAIDPLSIQASSNPDDAFVGKGLKGHKSFEQSLETKLEYASQKQNDDFAALEQHIEDLTQEKFSLQRSLEASKGLAESLAAENSSLTESYNQQASIVNQLKAEMERLQQEIKAWL